MDVDRYRDKIIYNITCQCTISFMLLFPSLTHRTLNIPKAKH